MDLNNSLPLFMQFKHSIMDELKRLELCSGDRIPSETALCRESTVSIRTVRRALRELERDGVIVRRQGLGSFLVDMEKTAPASSKGTIGVLFSDIAFMIKPMFSGFLSQLEGKVSASGYSFHLYSTGDRLGKSSLVPLSNILPENGLSALVATSALNDADLELLIRLKIPLVVFNDYKNRNLNTVLPDYYDAARKGISRLFDAGSLDICFVCGAFSNFESSTVVFNHNHFLRGVRDELQSRGSHLEAKRIIETEATFEDGFRVAQNISHSKKGVDAFFTTSQLVAEGIDHALRNMSILAEKRPRIVTFCVADFVNEAIQQMLFPTAEMVESTMALINKSINGDANAAKARKIHKFKWRKQ